MKLKQYVPALLLLCSVGAVCGQNRNKNNFSINIQYRPRIEYNNGYKFPLTEEEKSTTYIAHRARVGLNYKSGILSAKASLQNVSVWGSETFTPNNNMAMVETWVQLKNREGLFLKIGRQPLQYDDGRLLSACNWGPNGRFHDVLRMGYEDSQHTLHGAFAYNQDEGHISGGTYYQAMGLPYKTMQLLYYRYGHSTFTPSFIFINVGYENGDATQQKSTQRYVQTTGLTLSYRPTGQLKIAGIGYWQMGKRKDGQKINAFLASLRLDYQMSKNLGVWIGSDLLSGESNTGNSLTDNTFNAFTNVYGGHHSLYGYMDYFYASPFVNGLQPGMFDKYIGCKVSPFNQATFLAIYHHFSSATDIADSHGDLIDANLGSEVNFRFDYKIRKDIQLSVGYATYFATNSTPIIKGGDRDKWQDWGFVMLNVNPQIFFK